MKNDGWNSFGWQGVSFLKPEAWELVEVEGDANKGYARLDDGRMSRVQLRWHKVGSMVDMDSVAAKQEKIIRKKVKGSSTGLEVCGCGIKSFTGKKFRYRQEGKESVYYLLQCRDCCQVVLLGVFGAGGEDAGAIAERMVKSLKDHAVGGRILWGVYGFGFSAPAGLSLIKHQLRSGDLTFEFRFEGGEVFYHRLGIASLLLKETTLNGWAADFISRRYKKARVEVVFPPGAEEHVRVRGAERGRMWIGRKPLDGAFWTCARNNSILGVVERGAGEGAPALDELIKGVECHN